MDFTWRGQSAADDYGMVITWISPPALARQRSKSYIIPGRSGSVHIQDGAYDDIEITAHAYLPFEQRGLTGAQAYAQLASIKAWLTGSGYLTLYDRPGRAYWAMRISDIIFQHVINGFADMHCKIVWKCEPFVYHFPNTLDSVNIDGSGKKNYSNQGTVHTLPSITLFGTGAASISIHKGIIGQEYSQLAHTATYISEIGGSITLHSKLMEAISNNENASHRVSGQFPAFPEGNFQMKYSGGITAMWVTPFWRDL